MSEYAGRRQPTRIEDLDSTGTLFEKDELDDLVDTRDISYGEAREILGMPQDYVDTQNGVTVPIADRYAEELQLLDLTSGSSMREGFTKALDLPQVTNQYGEDLPRVADGAKRNIRTNNQLIHAVYHADELKRAGFDPQDVDDDATLMRMEYRRAYAGPENANKRAARRRYLRKQLGQLGFKQAK